MLVNLAGGSFLSYWGNILAGALKVLIGVNLVQAFDRDTRLSLLLVSYSVDKGKKPMQSPPQTCKEIAETKTIISFKHSQQIYNKQVAARGIFFVPIGNWLAHS